MKIWHSMTIFGLTKLSCGNKVHSKSENFVMWRGFFCLAQEFFSTMSALALTDRFAMMSTQQTASTAPYSAVDLRCSNGQKWPLPYL